MRFQICFQPIMTLLIQFDQMHGIVDLNKYFSDDELDEYIEGYVQDGNILNNGKLKVFPVAKSTEILTINKTDFDIHEVIRNTAASFEGTCTAKKFLSNFFWQLVPCMYMLTGTKSNRFYTNLLDNAIKFSNPESTIHD